MSDNQTLKRLLVLTPEESEAAEEAPERLAALVAERVAAANAELAQTRWVAMLPMLALEEHEGPYNEGPLGRGTVQLDLDEPGLKIWRGKKEVFAGSFPEWSVKHTEPKYEDCNPDEEECFCENPAFLDISWTDAAERAVVVQVSYYGTDMCWEPSPRLHVLPIPE